jgi:DNA replication protein DnaC
MYQKLLDNMETLKLEKIYSYLPNYLDSIAKSDVSLVDALLHLTEKEIAFRNERASKAQVAVSGFPFVKTLKDFDFDFQLLLLPLYDQELTTVRDRKMCA